MLVRVFKNKGRGSPRASIRYLLNKKEDEVRVLSGDPKLSQSIAENLKFKNSYTVGCLSFEELGKDISEESKREIMQRFEDCFLSGLDSTQYNISWIEHTDKDGRLELNFFIPNVELSTNKRLQPYFDKKDRGLADNFIQVINHEYKLSDPHDPLKRHITIPTPKNLPKETKNIKKMIDEYLLELVKNGEIENRQDIIDKLAEQGIKTTKTNERFISVCYDKDKKNLRLKGQLYNEDFKPEQIAQEQILAESREFEQRAEERYRKAQQRLKQYVERKRDQHAKLYQKAREKIAKSIEKVIIPDVSSCVVGDCDSINKQLQLLEIPIPKPKQNPNYDNELEDRRIQDRELEIEEKRRLQSRADKQILSTVSELQEEQIKEKQQQQEVKNYDYTKTDPSRFINNQDFDRANKVFQRVIDFASRTYERVRNTIQRTLRIEQRVDEIKRANELRESELEKTSESINRTIQSIDNRRIEIEFTSGKAEQIVRFLANKEKVRKAKARRPKNKAEVSSYDNGADNKKKAIIHNELQKQYAKRQAQQAKPPQPRPQQAPPPPQYTPPKPKW